MSFQSDRNCQTEKKRFLIVGIVLILFLKISLAQETTIHLAKTQFIEAALANYIQ